MRYDTKVFLITNDRSGHSLDHSVITQSVKKFANVSIADITIQPGIFGGVSDDNKIVRLSGDYVADQISFDNKQMYAIKATYHALGKTDFFIHIGSEDNG